jgi:TetR/AcrR family tetracycline transcriptional repressor
LDDEGIEGVSTRAVANKLDVRMNTVLWHIKTKGRLLELMADAIVGEVATEGVEGDGRQRAGELVRGLRWALLSHRDGARVVSGTFPAEPNTLGLADRLLSALLEDSSSGQQAAWTAWALFYFTLGLVQEEQTTPAGINDLIARNISEDAYPALFRVVDEFVSADFDERFEYGLTTMLSSLGSPKSR